MWAAPSGLIATGIATAPPARVARPDRLADAVALLAEPGAVALAGGTDLCAAYNEGLAPFCLVALDRLPELGGIAIDTTELRIGATVTHAAGSTHAELRAALPGFVAAWAAIANPRIRFRGTIGGNLMARHARYEMSLLLTALEARLRFARPDGGLHEHAPDDLWEDGVPHGALLHHIAIPRRLGLRFRYERSLRPQLTLAVARHEGGGLAAMATEWLRPHPLALDDATLAGLPDRFADPNISHWYARRAGAALLRRGRAALDA